MGFMGQKRRLDKGIDQPGDKTLSPRLLLIAVSLMSRPYWTTLTEDCWSLATK